MKFNLLILTGLIATALLASQISLYKVLGGGWENADSSVQ
jgi:hypothetical protein